ncbi:hypothetical protein Ocin01_18316 [Orchesella cincta]|uniref:Uncharacterized protein n=1 Tax=Orchesella cincta TaxID=48709 RepID=A0A1D2M5W5_ORCCI|nr:hypothetical protein Ocin01_18316 [Orchesella cincta]
MNSLSSSKWLCVVVLLIFLQVFETMAVQRTTNGHACKTSCTQGSQNKYWCITGGGGGSTGDHNAHCSPRSRTTYYGHPCNSICKRHLDYYYCDTAGSWDYCGPTD